MPKLSTMLAITDSVNCTNYMTTKQILNKLELRGHSGSETYQVKVPTSLNATFTKSLDAKIVPYDSMLQMIFRGNIELVYKAVGLTARSLMLLE